MNVREILTQHLFLDRRNDLIHKLTNNEIDGLVQFFASLKENEDYDDFYIHTVVDNTIKRRLNIK